MKKYNVCITARHSITVEAESEVEAMDSAMDELDLRHADTIVDEYIEEVPDDVE